MRTNRINISTKFIPKVYLMGEDRRKKFFSLMSRIGYRSIHFDFNRFAPHQLLDEKMMYGLFDIINRNDIRIQNSHLCVNPHENIWSNNDSLKEEMVWKVINQSLKYNKDLGIRDTVYHVPELNTFDVFKCQRYICAFSRLLELSEKYGCRICLENHYNAQVDNFVLPFMFNKYDADIVGFTFDSGHWLLSRNEKIFDTNFYGRLCLVHLHENDRQTDLHRIPDVIQNEDKWKRIFTHIKKNQNGALLIFEIGQNALQSFRSIEKAMEEMYYKIYNVMNYYQKV